jgi:hypothetical protein
MRRREKGTLRDEGEGEGHPEGGMRGREKEEGREGEGGRVKGGGGRRKNTLGQQK